MNNAKSIGLLVLSFCLIFPSAVSADPYADAVANAQAHAADPTSTWLPASSPGGPIIVVPDTSGTDQYGLQYDNGKLIVRTDAKQTFWVSTSTTTKAPGQDYNIVGTIASGSAAFVTTGNDMTRFLDTNKGALAGSDVTKLIERGLGIPNDGSHDAIVEYAVGNLANNLIRPTKHLNASTYDTTNPGDFKNTAAFAAKPAGMDPTTYTDFTDPTIGTGFFATYVNNAYTSAHTFPFTQFGYTYFYGNGDVNLSQIQGMSEFVILPNQDFNGTVLNKPYGTVTVYGIYPTQSYVYTRNDGTNFSAAAGSQYGNGFASFLVDGPCDTIWAGHRFQSKIKTDLINNNKIKIASGGSVSGGQGILVWSLNYEVENGGAT